MSEYYKKLEQASHKLMVIEANLSVYAGMTTWEGTAPGSEVAAKHYIERTAPIVKELRDMLK